METAKPTVETYIRVNNTDIEKVNQFKCLGSIITNNITSEINHRIKMANKSCYGLGNILGLKLLRNYTKGKKYKH
jgi:hypothetical protein